MKEILKSTIKSVTIIIIFTMLLLLKTHTIYSLSGYEKYYNLTTVIATMLIGIFVFSTGILFKTTKIQVIYSVIVSTLLGSVLFGSRIFFTYNKTFLSIFQIKSIFYVNEIGDALKSFYTLADLLFYIDLILLIAFYFFSKTNFFIMKNRRRNKKCTNIAIKKENRRPIIENKIITILIFLLISAFSMFTFLNTTLAVDKTENAETAHGKMNIMKNKSIWHYYIQDFKQFFTKDAKENFVKEDIIEKYFIEKNKEELNLDSPYVDITNLAKGKDIYILQLESFQNFVINKKINGKEITPNLNKFAKENVYFSNFHSQSQVSNTADCEHSSTTSLYPFANYALFQYYDKYKSENIYSIAESKDYYTAYMHANVGSFWNRTNVYNNMGVDCIVTKEQYKKDSDMLHNWIADHSFIPQSIDKIKNEFPKDKNKLVYMTAVSSHLPFTLEDLGENKSKYVNIDVGEYKNTLYGNYLESLNYVDTCFGNFLTKLKKENMLNNAIIIVYGDHFGIPKDNIAYREELLLKDELDNIVYNHTNVPCMIKMGDLKGINITEPKSQLDIKPTISKMLGVKDKYSFGTDLFSKSNEVHFANGSYIYGDYIYDASKNEYRNYRKNKTINMDKFTEVESLVHKKIMNKIELEKLISGTIVKDNYLEKVK